MNENQSPRVQMYMSSSGSSMLLRTLPILLLLLQACAGAVPQEGVEEDEPLPTATAALPEEETKLPNSTTPVEATATSNRTGDDANAEASTPESVERIKASRKALQGASETAEERNQTSKDLTLYLCEILMRRDKDGFEDLLHSEAPRDTMRYWWNASSKGRYFTKLFAKCTFDYLDRRNSNSDHLKIFIKRWVRRLDRYTLPAPVRFRRDPRARGAWRLISYSL
jgi:hypothetical protein